MRNPRNQIRRNFLPIVLSILTVLALLTCVLFFITKPSPKVVNHFEDNTKVTEKASLQENKTEEVENKDNVTQTTTQIFQNDLDHSLEIKKVFYNIYITYKNKNNGASTFNPITDESINHFNATHFLYESLSTMLAFGDFNEPLNIAKDIMRKIYKEKVIVGGNKGPNLNSENNKKYETEVIKSYFSGQEQTSYFIPSVFGAVLSGFSFTHNNFYPSVIAHFLEIFPQIKDDVFIMDTMTQENGKLKISGVPEVHTHSLGNYITDFLYLADQANLSYLFEKSGGIYNLLYKMSPISGLFSDMLTAFTGEPIGINGNLEYSLQVNGSSIYHDLLSLITMTNHSSKVAYHIFQNFTESFKKYYLKSGTKGYFVHNKLSVNQDNKMNIRSAFIPGMFARASTEFNDPELLQLAKDTFSAYKRMIDMNDLPPRVVSGSENQDLVIEDPTFDFAPDLFESLYYLWNATRNQTYRNIAWNLFVKFNTTCRTEFGLADYNTITRQKLPSFNLYLLSRTLKFLYLMYDDSFVRNKQFTFDSHGNMLKIWEQPMKDFDEQYFNRLPEMYDPNPYFEIK